MEETGELEARAVRPPKSAFARFMRGPAGRPKQLPRLHFQCLCDTSHDAQRGNFFGAQYRAEITPANTSEIGNTVGRERSSLSFLAHPCAKNGQEL
jgi:hypothetical protein